MRHKTNFIPWPRYVPAVHRSVHQVGGCGDSAVDLDAVDNGKIYCTFRNRITFPRLSSPWPVVTIMTTFAGPNTTLYYYCYYYYQLFMVIFLLLVTLLLAAAVVAILAAAYSMYLVSNKTIVIRQGLHMTVSRHLLVLHTRPKTRMF
jgi:hypothetical protein